ncbi:facilitated trehalose transporter Tret1 isoform X2 [Hetaerina americana]
MSETTIGVSQQTLVSATSNTARKLPQYAAALTATLGAFALGTALAWSSPAIPKLEKGEAGFEVTSAQSSWVGSLMTLGAAAIALPIGYCMDQIGRKLTMILLAVPFVMGWVLIVWAINVDMLYAGRFFCGMSGGAFAVVAPVYIGETAQKEIRGSLGTYFQLMICAGILFAYVVGSYLTVFWFSIVCGIIPIVFAAGILVIPESPAYYLSKGKVEEAKKSLRWLRGKEYDFEAELAEMQVSAENAAESKRNVNIISALTARATINALVISLGLMIFQQLSGINAVIFYTDTIFQAANVKDSSVSTIIVGVVQLVATFISTLIVDRFGRRFLLILSDSLMAVCCVALGVFFYLQSIGNDVSNLGWLPLTSLCIFIIVFSLGYGPVPWFMIGELFSAEVKAVAGPISSITNWLLAFVVTKFFKDITDAWGKHTAFWVFAVISAIGVLFVFFVVIETKGKSLEEIQQELGARGKSRKNKVDIAGTA